MSIITLRIRQLLTDLYQKPGRHYHSLTHVNTLLDLLARHRAAFADPEVVGAAIWFHDAVYDPRATEPGVNEIHSADLAVAWLEGTVDGERLARIKDMILATITHVPPPHPDAGHARDAAMFLDMDLSILGTEENEFDAYEAAVRQEYAWVDEDGWRKGRARVLEGFMAKEAIFNTGLFRELFEEKARRNIARSLARLKESEGGSS